MSELLKMISRGEGLNMDFKFSIEDQRKIARTLVAFANCRGGSLLIGVKDNGKVVGVNPEEEYYMIEAAASTYCFPPVTFQKKIWKEEHRLVLEIVVPKSEMKHKAKDEEENWRTYVRVKDHTLLGNKIIEKVWALQKHGVKQPEHFDDNMRALLEVVAQFQPITLSKLYRKLSISMKQVDSILSSLVYWDIITMEMDENGTYYSLTTDEDKEITTK